MIPRRGSHRREGTSSRSDDPSINGGVDADIMEFIQKYITSYTKWEVLKYFAENPGAVETPRGFARRLGKDVRQVSEALKSLARAGIVGNGQQPDNGGYTLNANDAQRTILQRIAETARTNNRFRLLLNYHITKASLAKYRSTGF